MIDYLTTPYLFQQQVRVKLSIGADQAIGLDQIISVEQAVSAEQAVGVEWAVGAEQTMGVEQAMGAKHTFLCRKLSQLSYIHPLPNFE